MHNSKPTNIICVPAINTEKIKNNIAEEITFRDSLRGSTTNRIPQSQLNSPRCQAVTQQTMITPETRNRYIGSRTQSLNPQKLNLVRKKMSEHKDNWTKTISYF